MAPPRETLGSVPCLCCDRPVPAKKSAGGAISVSCPWCDLSAYAKEGTESHRVIMGKLPAAIRTDEPAPAPVPKPKPKSTFLGL